MNKPSDFVQQRYIELTKVWDWNERPSGYMLEFQYIFKRKKDAIKIMELLEKSVKFGEKTP